MAYDKEDAVSISITGLACRFPGDAGNVSQFWDVLCRGSSMWSKIPKDRFDPQAFATSMPTGGHFLKHDVSLFDSGFFRVSHTEACAMDPQQRLMMEVVYEALEAAGYPLDTISGTRTGVFMGQFTNDYRDIICKDAEASLPFSMTGLHATSLSNRISWMFDSKGPSMTIDTACSSSLTALHLACQSIRHGESEMAIVGGCNLILNPDMFMFQTGQKFLSPDGKCKTFDISADGYGRGEGFAVLVLRKTQDAIRHRDPIRAVIRGTGANQDGRTNGFTLPSSHAQEALIRRVYSSAGIDLNDTDYVEAHGTGTQAGDLEETTALGNTFGATRANGACLIIGSVKSSIGHLEAGAGLAGVIKSVLMLEQATIPPNILFHTENPKLRLHERNLKVPTSVIPWPAEKPLRRISVNSFGYGGSNAHAILDNSQSLLVEKRMLNGSTNGTDEASAATNQSSLLPARLFAISAQDKQGLTRAKDKLKLFLKERATSGVSIEEQSTYMASLAFTLGERRTHLQWKTFAVASSLDELGEELSSADETRPVQLSSQKPRLGFVFTGQGAQWANMGMELMQYSVFRDSIEAAENYLQHSLKCTWNIIEELSRGNSTSKLAKALYSQTLCTVVQVALVDLLKEWQILPSAVVGHSSGEIAAAYCSGALTREDALRVAYSRGVVSSKLRDEYEITGAMMAVGASLKVVEEEITKSDVVGKVHIACVNSPKSVTVSGEPGGINALFESLQARGLFARKLQVDTAYHSPHMLAVAREYLEAIGSIAAPSPNKHCTMYSSVTGSAIPADELGPAYWVRNMVSSVQFSTAIQQLMRPTLPKGSSSEIHDREKTVDVLVELGPHSALHGPAKQCLNSLGLPNVPYHSVLLRHQSAIDTSLNLVGTLFTEGYVADLAKVNKSEAVSEPLVDLPTYPWNHSQSHWAESRVARKYRLRKGSRNGLVGQLMPSLVAGEQTWRGYIRLSDKPWVAGHKIQGTMLYPAAGFIAMAVEAALSISPSPQNAAAFRLRDIHLISALIIETEDSVVEYTVCLKPHLNMATDNTFTWMEFIVSSCQGSSDELVKNCHGLIMLDYVSAKPTPNDSNRHAASLARFDEATRVCNNSIQTRQFYGHLDSVGLNYGPDFQNLTDISIAPLLSVGAVQIPALGLKAAERYHLLHPATLDAVFHLVFAALQHDRMRQAMVPKSIDEIVISAEIPYLAGARITGFSDVERNGFRNTSANIIMLDEINKNPVLRVAGLCCSVIGGGSIECDYEMSEKMKSICSKLIWRPSIGLLQPEEQIAASQQTLGSKGGYTTPVNNLIMMIHHCNPEVDISEIVLDTVGFYPTYFEKDLSDVFKTAKYTLLYSDDAIKQSLCERSEEWNSRRTHRQPVDVRDLLEPLTSDGESKKSSDIVIFTHQDTGCYELRDIMQNAFGRLTDTGRMCLTVPVDEAENTKTLGRELGLTQWTSIESKNQGHGTDIVILIGSRDVSLRDVGSGITPHDVVILQGDDPSPACIKLAAGLKASLDMKGYSSSTESWNISRVSLEGKWCISLLEVDGAVLPECTEEEFSRIKEIILRTDKLLWMTNINDPGSALAVGVARTFRNEEPGRNFDTVQMDLRDTCSLERIADLGVRVLTSTETEGDFAIIKDMIHVSRVVEDDEMNGSLHRLAHQNGVMKKTVALGEAGPLKLGIRNAGLLDSLCYESDPIADTELRQDEVEISVKVASLNFRDVMTVMGQVPGIDLGFDAAGVVRRVGSAVTRFKVEDRVVMCNPGAHRTIHRAKADYCAAVPETMSFEEAATIPLVHGTAWYALVRVAQAKAGQSLLIHAAAGGVGQAALQIAKHLGMEIFATVGSNVKRSLLRDEYGIPDDHIFNSRDVAFADKIKTMTSGRGVDVVINSLTGEALRRTWYSIAPFGTFIEIGLKDILGNSALDMKPFAKGVTFAFFDLKSIALSRPDVMGDIMKAVFEMQHQGITRPISPFITYPASQVEIAFRLMQTGHLLGKALLSFSDDDVVPVLKRETDHLNLDPNAAYLLVGGLGGLGRSISKMLVRNGARKLIFFSRSGASTTLAQQLVLELQNSGAQVYVHAGDVSNSVSVREAVEVCEAKLGPIRGVIQCSMLLRDTLFRNMSHQEWMDSIRPKVHGTWNLHKSLPDVDFFVSLGSFTAIFGNKGQSNYVAGCAYQDAIAHLRHKKGLRAVTIDLGVVRDVGVLAEQGMSNTLADFEVPYGLFEYEVLNLVKMAINSADGLPQILTGLATAGRAAAAGVEPAWYLASDPKFAIMAKTGGKSATLDESDSGDRASTQSRLHRAKSLAEAADIVVDALVARVAKMLRTSTSEIDTSRFLHSYGVDSLVAIEIVNWVLAECKAQVSTVDILASTPLVSTAKKIASLSTLVSKDLASN